jgi:hypothetical protein
MNKKELDYLNKELVVTDILVRLTVIENLLMSKNLITKEEYTEAIQSLSEKLARNVLENAKVPGDIDKMIEEFKNNSKINSGN